MNLLSNGFNSLFEETQEKLPESQVIHRENERANLLTITRLVLRSFLEQSMRSPTRVIETDVQPLCDLLMMLEKTLWHGFRSSAQKTVIFLKSPDAEMWGMIGKVAKSSESMRETVSCVDQLENLRTPICKIRAFLRISLMQKRLSDFFSDITQSPILKDYYEPWALMRHETIIHISGGLMGLRVLDCNVSLNNERLQEIPLSVDLSPYIKLPTVSLDDKNGITPTHFESDDEKKRLLDQNSYLEERIRQLTCNMENMKKRLDSSDTISHKSGISLDTEMVSFKALEESNGRYSQDSAFQEEKHDLLSQIAERDDTIRLLQQQLTDTKSLNADLYLKVRHAEDCCRKVEQDFVVEKNKHKAELDQYVTNNKALTKRVEFLEQEMKKRRSSKGAADLEPVETVSELNYKLEQPEDDTNHHPLM